MCFSSLLVKGCWILMLWVMAFVVNVAGLVAKAYHGKDDDDGG
jgi:hypothetical protein